MITYRLGRMAVTASESRSRENTPAVGDHRRSVRVLLVVSATPGNIACTVRRLRRAGSLTPHDRLLGD